MANDWTGNTLNVADGALSTTSMRYHELAIQRWLNKIFTLRWGVPVPVVFTSPMDAFSLFSKLWSEANNPFQYLLDVKDAKGVPLYQPYPSPVRYPVISVYRKGWKYRQYQNYSIHRQRYINWPTVSDSGSVIHGKRQQGTDLTLCQLGEVTTSRFPMAFDYRFQIDHFCNRPDTQAFFTSQLFREFWRTGGPVLQTWTVVKYPGFGDKLIRVYIDGDIENLTPEEPEEGKNVEFRTSFTVVMEGYDIDVDYKIYPALWNLLIRFGSAPPQALDAAFDFTGTVSLREAPLNPTVEYREKVTVMPPEGTCAASILASRMGEIDQIIFQSLIVTYPGVVDPPGYPPPAGIAHFGGGTLVTGTPPPPAFVNAGTDVGNVSMAFFAGTYFGTDAPPVFVDGGSTVETGSNASAFRAGSMDLFIYIEQGSIVSTFLSGTQIPVTSSAGTFVDTGTNASLFFIGSHVNAIVSADAGTEVGTIFSQFTVGTHADVVINGGSYYESGTMSSAFTAGTHIAFVIEGGSYFATGSMSAGFLSGVYA